MRAERRREGRRIRKMRREGRRLNLGYLFWAPADTGPAVWPEEWIPLGDTAEGFSWPAGWVDMQPGDSIVTNEHLDPVIFTTEREATISLPLGEVSGEFLALVEEFVDENEECLRRLAEGPG